MHKAADIAGSLGISGQTLQQHRSEGLIKSELECSKEEIFRILCARCLSESGATPAQIKTILSAVHPSRQLNVGIYTPHNGKLTVFFVPHSNTDERRSALDQIWRLQSKSRVSVMINFEKIMNDIEAALGAFVIKGRAVE